MPILRYWDATSNQYQPCATGPPGPTGAQGPAGTNGTNGAQGPPGPAWPIATKILTNPSYSTTNAPYTLIDVNNARLTYTMPASGQSMLELSCEFNNSAVGVQLSLCWSNVPTSNTGLVIGGAASGNIDYAGYKVIRWFAAGTPGNSYTYYLQWAIVRTAGTATIQGTLMLLAAYPL